MLHPQSGMKFGAGAKAEVIWTVAEKLDCVRMLRDEIGLPEDASMEKSQWDSRKSDTDYGKEKA